MSKASRNRNRGTQRQKPKRQMYQKKIELKSQFRISLGTVLGIVLAFIGVYIAFLELVSPRISLTINQNQHDLLKSDFVFSNQRYLFTLRNKKRICGLKTQTLDSTYFWRTFLLMVI